MKTNQKMISVEEAQQIIFETTPQAEVETINLENTSGRILAQDIIASRHQPPFNRVAMDGIALNSKTKKTELKIQAIQAAGSPQLTLEDENNCIEVMTGASLPLGCDCVIQYEKVSISEGIAKIEAEDIVENRNIHAAASDYEQGEVLLQAGIKISSPVAAIIASQGSSEIMVYKRPNICIISTGSELVALDEKIAPHQIFMSNSYAIENELKSFGVANIERIHIVDDEETTEKVIADCLERFDTLILTGGVSKGKFDFIPETLNNLGVTNHFHKITQKPGKPMWYGTTQSKKQVFALPGNPVSCLVCLRRYVLPSLIKSLSLEEKPIYGELQSEINFKRSFTYFVAVEICHSPTGKLLFFPVSSNGSGDFSSLASSDGFIELPAEQESFKPGEIYQYFPWHT